jgi:hypothetical protein
VCGGRYEGDLFSLKISQVSAYDDFPNGHITYSFRIFCHQPAKMTLLAGQPIMADRNPIFEKVSEDMFMVKLDNESSRSFITSVLNHVLDSEDIVLWNACVPCF